MIKMEQKMTKNVRWFKDNVSENEDDLIKIGEAANKNLHETISLGIADPRTTIALYGRIFEVICDEVASKEDEWSEFNLNVAGHLNIGYTTTDSADDEKSGNFMVYMSHLETNKNNDILETGDETDTIRLCAEWNAKNIKEQPEILNQIMAKGKKALSDTINIKVDSHEFVMPIFCITHRVIIDYLKKMKTSSNNEPRELNIAGLYTVGIEDTDDAEESIYFIPSISMKLRFKSDKIATASQDD